ncbi:MAG TPA: hypothetical protein VFQ38_19260 [Longimicrobiales bacterium]|nr:hypothetical protein [Longimicrobiales bacterium]
MTNVACDVCRGARCACDDPRAEVGGYATPAALLAHAPAEVFTRPEDLLRVIDG